jgi:hypothetical protein
LELAVAVAVAMIAVQAQALTLDFEEFEHGTVVSDSALANYKGAVISVVNFHAGHQDLGIVFDSEREIDTADPDLERGNGWAAGNLAPDSVLGNILIIQENNDGRRQAGTITLSLAPLLTPFNLFEFDLIDFDEFTGVTWSDNSANHINPSDLR